MAIFIRRFAWLASVLCIAGCAPWKIHVPHYAVPEPTESHRFVAGAAKVDIIPPRGFPTSGFSSRPQVGVAAFGGAEDGRTVFYNYGWNGGIVRNSLGGDVKLPALDCHNLALLKILKVFEQALNREFVIVGLANEYLERRDTPDEDLDRLMPDSQWRVDDQAPRFEWKENPGKDWDTKDRTVSILRRQADRWIHPFHVSTPQGDFFCSEPFPPRPRKPAIRAGTCPKEVAP